MNQRSTKIVQLLSKEKDEITVSGFAEYFQVSQKTIRNDLKEINEILDKNKKQKIDIKPGGGIVSIPKDFKESLSLLLEGNFYNYKLSKEERKKVASAIIVNSADYITLADIADRLMVSRATVINDLKEIKKFIRQGNLEVISHANKGLRIDGLESDKRKFLFELLRPTLRTYDNHKNIISEHVHVQSGDINIIQKIIAEQERCYKKFLPDNSFREILLYLRILINRNKLGEFLEPQPEINSDNYMFSMDILKYVSQYCDVVISDDDIKNFSTFLDEVRFKNNGTFNKNTMIIQMITRQYISTVSTELGINLNVDYDFFENLSNHLESIFSAPPMDYPEADIIDEVLEDNQDVLDVVIDQMPVIYKFTERKLTEIEVKYIAIHVCAAIERKKNKEVSFRVIVACHAGIGTSILLLEKLKRHFKFRVVDVISAHEAINIKPNAADFVISTVPLESCPLEYVVVSAAFNDADYIRVGNRIDALRNSRNIPDGTEDDKLNASELLEEITPVINELVEPKDQARVVMKELRKVVRNYFKQSVENDANIISPSLHHLLRASDIEVDVECTDWKDAIRRSAEQLVDQGYIEDRYVDAMIESVNEYGPYIVLSPGFAMPHAKVEEGSIRLGMHLIRLKNPVPFGVEELDPIEFVCCLSAIDHRSYLKAFFNLVNMLKDEEYRKKLHEAVDGEEMARIIEQYEYSIVG
ncbi:MULTISPECIES: BglG family transcription antiterminator [Anaerostipes]|jgi:mannitol operon transcriptional antiterminator|uniref:BglG family transcription antiterminator n=1 Tax=Anaerostipes TaxID=207244 RepID=UPI00033D312C|nr:MULTISPECIES: PTS sugar transporter subunit IIA [Anaerostipes]MBR9959698.1 PTS sugar transporter subunit IIA [Anaerostipes sp. Marseille-Q3525]MCU6781636.1 PTS sugar transporter subunit IIA [Anaerostipes amylophilus]CDD70572.1 phosphoenolpyruvate-dependent sugar phosphotransferase [Firmicutes bacterium CAG:270]CUO17299.1 Probable licABCH operon regulator [Anaerostipes hadrus]